MAKLSDLGFDDARIQELRNHAQNANGSNSFGYTSDTEHHFRELDNKTSNGSIEADMRKIGEHLGYEHWGTANPERIKDFIMTQEKAPQAAAAPEPKPVQLSDRAAEAKAYTGAYEKVMLPRQGDYVIKNDQSVVNDFDTEYNLQLLKAKEPYMADGSDVPDSAQAEATDYANDYKKAVADTLVPKVSF